MAFLAMAALLDTTSNRRWLKAALAGLAVGMGVGEGDDVGALFSILVAGFLLWQTIIAPGSSVKNYLSGALKLALVVGCAGWLAAQAVSELVATNIKGVHGAAQDVKTKEERWDWATQWSMPKSEALAFVVPGLFGYRLDTPDGGAYWGATGRDAPWRKFFESGNAGDPPKKGFKRYTGGGYYAGVPVVLIALWAALQSFRRKDSVFSLLERQNLWFWMVVGFLSFLFAMGRYAPFYKLIYALPYFSTMRNPTKFIYFVTCALLVLFTYGVEGLWRRYMQGGPASNGPRALKLSSWWAKASKFEKGWVLGCVAALGLSLLAWAVYAKCQDQLEAYLVRMQFEPAAAHLIANFSVQQVLWFVLPLALCTGLMVWIFKGGFAGSGATSGFVVLALLVAFDLGRANLPWIRYWEMDDKYATNPVLEFLRDKPYEHRVALIPIAPLGPVASRNNNILSQVYKVEWLQHEMPYFNIQSLDNVQMPRKTESLFAYERAFQPTNQSEVVADITRRWELTNTRYVFGVIGVEEYINRHLAGTGKQLRIAQRFSLVPKPGAFGPLRAENLTATLDDNGPMALYEFEGALPRAKLFSNWIVNTNDPSTLHMLVESDFDPQRSVLVSDPIAPPAPSATNQEAGAVEIVSYAPKKVVLKANALVNSVLAINSRHDPDWHVFVDGHRKPLLRCNYLVRGVALTAGAHTVEFRFEPPYGLLWVSLSAVVAGAVLLAFVLVPVPRQQTAPVRVPANGASAPAAQTNGSGNRRGSKTKANPKLAPSAKR